MRVGYKLIMVKAYCPHTGMDYHFTNHTLPEEGELWLKGDEGREAESMDNAAHL